MLHEKINEIEMYAIMEIIVKYSYPCSKQYSSKLMNKNKNKLNFLLNFGLRYIYYPNRHFRSGLRLAQRELRYIRAVETNKFD
jgi:hypothetical protein